MLCRLHIAPLEAAGLAWFAALSSDHIHKRPIHIDKHSRQAEGSVSQKTAAQLLQALSVEEVHWLFTLGTAAAEETRSVTNQKMVALSG